MIFKIGLPETIGNIQFPNIVGNVKMFLAKALGNFEDSGLGVRRNESGFHPLVESAHERDLYGSSFPKDQRR